MAEKTLSRDGGGFPWPALALALVIGGVAIPYQLVQDFKSSAALRAYYASPGCSSPDSPGEDPLSSKFCSVSREKIMSSRDEGSIRHHHYWVAVSNGAGRVERVEVEDNYDLRVGDTVVVQRFDGTIMKISDGDATVVSKKNPQSDINHSQNSLVLFFAVFAGLTYIFFKQRRSMAADAISYGG